MGSVALERKQRIVSGYNLVFVAFRFAKLDFRFAIFASLGFVYLKNRRESFVCFAARCRDLDMRYEIPRWG
jgi:hypothetical protein